ncbi:MAG: S1 RNA-binding domain-containing protein, partial [Terriglobales bacterium]
QGPVTNITKFGAFVQLAEGIEGMVHVSEISAEKRINHPQDVLKSGQVVQAQVLAIDTEKRIIRLSMKQLVPTGLDEYLEEHKEGDIVTGRILDASGADARVELGQGIQAHCRIPKPGADKQSKKEDDAPVSSPAKLDLSSLGNMLQARWKTGAQSPAAELESLSTGQVRSFRIAKLDRTAKKIELELE